MQFVPFAVLMMRKGKRIKNLFQNKKTLDKPEDIWYNKYRKNEREEIKNDGRDEKRDDGSYENYEKSV